MTEHRGDELLRGALELTMAVRHRADIGDQALRSIITDRLAHVRGSSALIWQAVLASGVADVAASSVTALLRDRAMLELAIDRLDACEPLTATDVHCCGDDLLRATGEAVARRSLPHAPNPH